MIPQRPDEAALYVYGITRSRGWRSPRGENDEVLRVRYRDLEAVVRAREFRVPRLEEELIKEHQHTVEEVMRRGTILPLPFGVVFRGRRVLIRFLQDQYLVLDEALAFLEGHWELRMHIAQVKEGEPPPELHEAATQIYTELRRLARAAVPFPREAQRLLSAAFLVDRSAWIDFVARAEDLGANTPALSIDVTGPWPPYDFVRLADGPPPIL
jgi:hypothetical protein